MEKNADGYYTVVIKDFNEPSPNGQMYDVDDPRSRQAIKNLCNRPCLYGEIGHPALPNHFTLEAKVRRCSEIALERAGVVLKDLAFDEEKKTISAMIKPIPSVFPHLIESLDEGKVVFGMRALTRATPNGEKGWPIDAIVTFDIINAG